MPTWASTGLALGAQYTTHKNSHGAYFHRAYSVVEKKDVQISAQISDISASKEIYVVYISAF